MCVCVCVCVCVCMCVYHIFCVHSSVDGQLGCFCILAIENNTAMNTGAHVSFWISVFVFFRYVPRSGITGSYGSPIFKFLRNFHTVFHMAAPIYNPTNSVQEGFSVIHILTNICYLWYFWMIAILTWVRWYVIVVLICVSLLISNIEHLFMCLLAIYMSLGKISIQVFCPFLNRVVWVF